MSEQGGRIDDNPQIGLKEAIRSLRAELSEAMRESEGKDLRFRVGPVELEFLVQVTRDSSAEAGVTFWVVSAGGKTGVSTASTHRVKLSLVPVTADGKDVEVADAGARPP